jgi:hypothetical protein
MSRLNWPTTNSSKQDGPTYTTEGGAEVGFQGISTLDFALDIHTN